MATSSTSDPEEELTRETEAAGPPGLRGDEEELAPGTLIGRYEIRSLIGKGGMGAVYLARDLRLDREVAVKVAAARVAADVSRVLKEARALAALSHPNTLTVHDFGVRQGRPFIVMERLRGDSLRVLLDAGKPSLEETLRLARLILAGLSAAHEADIVHLDVKPENVVLLEGGSLKLVDFGIAQRAASGQAAVAGTKPYMAPEQREGRAVDARTDVFAFGVLLHELLAGRRPARDEERAVVRDVSGGPLRDLLARCLAEEPGDRPASATVVLRELEAIPAERAFDTERRDTEAWTALAAEDGEGWRIVPGPGPRLVMTGAIEVEDTRAELTPTSKRSTPRLAVAACSPWT